MSSLWRTIAEFARSVDLVYFITDSPRPCFSHDLSDNTCRFCYKYDMKRLNFVYILLLLPGLLAVSCATGERSRAVGELSAEQLKGMLDRGQGVVVVDNRTEYEYRQGHIPGSISMAPHLFVKMGTLLPADKNIEVVFYCRGSG